MSFPHYYQLDSMDCGPACLKSIAQYYGKHYSLPMLREKCHITRNGVSLMGICDAANGLGLRTLGMKITWEQFREEAELPCIIHWNKKHFVVVYKIKKDHRRKWTIYVSDPAAGLLQYDEQKFRQLWEEGKFEDGEPFGIALFLTPTAEFHKESAEKEERKMHLSDMLHYLAPYKKYFVRIGLAMLTASIISLFFPYLTQAIVDSGIYKGDLHIVLLILLAQLMLAFGQMGNDMCRSWLMLHVTTRIGISIISDFLNKLLRLPIAFFDSKNIGDVLQRIGDYGRIQGFLTGTLLSTAVGVINFIIYTVIMTQYSVKILLILLAGSAVYGAWITLFMKKRRKLDYLQFQEAATNQSSLVQIIEGIQDIKMNNCGNHKLWEWQYIQAKLYKISTHSLRLGQIQQLAQVLPDELFLRIFRVLSTAKSLIVNYGLFKSHRYLDL